MINRSAVGRGFSQLQGRRFMGRATLLRLIGTTLGAIAAAQGTRAQSPSAPVDADVMESRVTIAVQAEPVRFHGQDLFTIRAPLGTLSVSQRAHAIETRLASALSQVDLGSQPLRLEPGSQSTDIYLGQSFVTSVTDADSEPLGRSRDQQAADLGLVLQRLVQSDLQGRTARSILLGAARSLAALVLAGGLILLIRWSLARLAHWLTELAHRSIPVVEFVGLTLFSPSHAIPLTLRALRGLRWLLVLIVVVAAAEYVLSQFPWTQGLASAITRSALAALSWVFGGIVSFMPKVLYLTAIAFATRYILRALRFVLDRWATFGSERNFPPEWVRPTYQIIRFIVVALALVVAFPYLPGSDSKAFQGVSVFVGVLFSLGSSAAIGNMVAGIVLIYMRAVKVGDRVKIADTVGDVIACEFLTVKVRTIKNVDVAIPNSLALSNHIINFSKQAAEGQLILHTTVTIGYGAEWRTVHELLIAAGHATVDVEATPEPFVLQTSLNDFYVGYEINVYTRNAQAMARIYSELHANIQDKFNEAGVEILSPHYGALRDGNRTAVPDRYLPKDYRPAGIGLSWLRSKPKAT